MGGSLIRFAIADPVAARAVWPGDTASALRVLRASEAALPAELRDRYARRARERVQIDACGAGCPLFRAECAVQGHAALRVLASGDGELEAASARLPAGAADCGRALGDIVAGASESWTELGPSPKRAAAVGSALAQALRSQWPELRHWRVAADLQGGDRLRVTCVSAGALGILVVERRRICWAGAPYEGHAVAVVAGGAVVEVHPVQGRMLPLAAAALSGG